MYIDSKDFIKAREKVNNFFPNIQFNITIEYNQYDVNDDYRTCFGVPSKTKKRISIPPKIVVNTVNITTLKHVANLCGLTYSCYIRKLQKFKYERCITAICESFSYTHIRKTMSIPINDDIEKQLYNTFDKYYINLVNKILYNGELTIDELKYRLIVPELLWEM